MQPATSLAPATSVAGTPDHPAPAADRAPPPSSLLKSALRRRSGESIADVTDLAAGGPGERGMPRRRSSGGSADRVLPSSPRLVRLATEPASIGVAARRPPSRADQRALDLADAVARLGMSPGTDATGPLAPGVAPRRCSPPYLLSPRGGSLSPNSSPAADAVDLRMLRFLQAAGAAPTTMTSLLQRRCTSMEQLLELPRDEWDAIVPDEGASERLWQRVCKARRGSLTSSHDGSRRPSSCPSDDSSSEFEEATDW
jgi:hypothetical protein